LDESFSLVEFSTERTRIRVETAKYAHIAVGLNV